MAMPFRVLQLTDLHLLADPDARLKGVPTRQTLADVLAQIRREEPEFDRVILTGDLAHDERRETYLALRRILEPWLPRCRFLPGNHDDRASMREIFPEAVPAGDGPMPFSEPAGAWRLIGLDTHVPGQIEGRIDDDQLRWLWSELSQHAGTPVALFMHHPPISVHSPWLDRIGLADPERFRQIVAIFPQIRVIACGHVHHEFSGSLAQAKVYTTPSTAIQFEPSGDESQYSDLPPGYRVFAFDGRRVTTAVRRLPTCEFPAAKDS